MPSNSRHRKRRAATVFGEKYVDREKAAGESRFIALINKRDRDLNNLELDQLDHFLTATNLASGLHLPFYGTGCDWIASALKEMPRNRSPEVLGLSLNVLGWGGDAIMVTSKPDASGRRVPPVAWCGSRMATVFQKVVSFNDFAAAATVGVQHIRAKNLVNQQGFLHLTTPPEQKSFQKPLSAAKVAAAASAARFAADSGGPAAASVAHSLSETPLRGPRWMGLLSNTSPGDPRGGAPAPLRL